MHTTSRITAALLLAGTVTLGAVGTAHASDDDSVDRRGSCSGSTDWRLRAKQDDGRIEVKAKVDSTRVGQVWTWTLNQNGAVAAQGTGTTRGTSASFEIERDLADAVGADAFTFVATNAATGEVCTAAATL